MKTNYTIPFFIPHRGCPHQCIFCDQKKITGQEAPKPDEVPEKIKAYLPATQLRAIVWHNRAEAFIEMHAFHHINGINTADCSTKITNFV